MIGTYLLYNMLLILSTAFVYLYEKSTLKFNANMFLSVAFLILFIPAAIRYNVGTDYASYVDIFYKLKEGNSSHVEIGYQYLNNLIAFLGLDAQWLVALVAFITYAVMIKAYPKKGAWVVHFLFITVFYLYTYSNFRTSIVLAIMFYATMKYINDKKILHFLVFTLISTSFHSSALILLVIPILFSTAMIRFISARFMWAVMLALLMVFIVFKDQFIEIFIVNNTIVSYMGYSNYLQSRFFFSDTKLSSGLGVLLRALPFILFILLSAKELKKNKQLAFGVNLSLLYILLIVLTATKDIFSRLEVLFYTSYMIVGYLAYIYFKPTKRVLFILSTTAIMLLLFELKIYKTQSTSCRGWRISPYVSIFNKDDDKSLNITRKECRE